MGRWFGSSFDDKERIGASSGHWTFKDNVKVVHDIADLPADLTTLRIDGDVNGFEELSRFSNLEQVHLINPTAAQIATVFEQTRIKRLLFGDIRKLSLEGLERLDKLEELAFLNCSAPKNLNVLGALPNLRSLMLENLGGFEDWSSLGHIRGLRCLCLTGGFVEATTYVDSLAFLQDLTEIEHLYIAGISYRGPEPAFSGLRHCPNLKMAVVVPGCFSIEDNAFLEAVLPPSARYFKHTYEVNGLGNACATNLADALSLPTHEICGQPEGRLSWIPLVQVQKGRSFTRSYTGPRDKVIERLKDFEECYAKALISVTEHR